MTATWLILAVCLVIFLVISLVWLQRYGRKNVSRHPENLSGLPADLRNSEPDSAEEKRLHQR